MSANVTLPSKSSSTLWGRFAHVSFFGLAFKPQTDDVREAPAIALIHRLQELGANVAHDPAARTTAERVLPPSEHLTYCDDPYDASDCADALVIATDWQEFKNLDWRAIGTRMIGNTIADGRGLLHSDEMRAIGFSYIGVVH